MLDQIKVRELSAILAGKRPPQRKINEVALREDLEALVSELGDAAPVEPAPQKSPRRTKMTDRSARQNRKMIKQADTIKYFAERLAKNLAGGDPEIHSLLLAHLAALGYTRLSGREHETPVSGHQWLKDLRVLAECCTQLETFVANQQKQLQGPRDEWMNSLMLRLAQIYCTARSEHLEPNEMPKGQNTIFIRFCDAVMEAFFETEDVNRGQLANQWRRLISQLYPEGTQAS